MESISTDKNKKRRELHCTLFHSLNGSGYIVENKETLEDKKSEWHNFNELLTVNRTRNVI
jgi:hypothetical protein